MKKVLIYLIIVAIGEYGVYYALGQMDKNESNTMGAGDNWKIGKEI